MSVCNWECKLCGRTNWGITDCPCEDEPKDPRDILLDDAKRLMRDGCGDFEYDSWLKRLSELGRE